MLTDLSITNIAIIDRLQLSLRPGLTVLTGETGAGKSIIIDAVGLVMGGRASSDLIRSGCDEATVEALFDLTGLPDLQQALEAAGFDSGPELLVRRSISRSGRNRVFINGGMATLTQLGEIAGSLINIYGQHESQTLLRPDSQLALLDAFSGAAPLRARFGAIHQERDRAVRQLEEHDARERDAAGRIDLLSFQSAEIAAAAITPGEDESLQEQRGILAGAARLGEVSAGAFDTLYGGDTPLLGQLRRTAAAVREASAIDPLLAPLAAALDESYLQIEDVALRLRDYAARIETDPAALQKVDDRLDLINRLTRKYGGSVAALLDYRQEIDRELDGLADRDGSRQRLADECDRLREELDRAGQELTALRRAGAGRLQQALEAEVRQLAMKDAAVVPQLEPLPEPRATGYERVEFLFSPNPGEQPRPLARIASGGELSRLMLAIKQVLPEGGVPTLVFDEVDTGISGATSRMVGKKLRSAAGRQQVLCITHLPQVASCAHHHLLIEKSVTDGRTVTTVRELDAAGRAGEVARLLAGETITGSALAHAAEMLARHQEP